MSANFKTVKINPTIHFQARNAAFAAGITLIAFIEKAIVEAMNKKRKIISKHENT